MLQMSKRNVRQRISVYHIYRSPTVRAKYSNGQLGIRSSGFPATLLRKLTNSVMTLMPAFYHFSSLFIAFISLFIATHFEHKASPSREPVIFNLDDDGAGLPKLTRPTSLEAGNTDDIL